MFSGQIHSKAYTIGIKGTTDDGSKVKDINIYAQEFFGSETADYNKAVLVGVIRNVDLQPSYRPSIDSDLAVRNISGYPISTAADKTPKHSPEHIYPFKFANYTNGAKYHFWALGIDNAGNIEQLNASGDNSLNGSLLTTVALYDDTKPQFDDISVIKSATIAYSATPYEAGYHHKITVHDKSGFVTIDGVIQSNPTLDQIKAFLIGRIIQFQHKVGTNGAIKVSSRYIKNAKVSGSDIRLMIDSGDGLDITDNVYIAESVVKINPIFKLKGGIGFLEFQVPTCSNPNLLGYKVERAFPNKLTKGNTDDDDLTTIKGSNPVITYPLQNFYPISSGATEPCYHLVGYYETNTIIDRGLKIPKSYFASDGTNSPIKDRLRFLYKITPVSVYETESLGEILGDPIYFDANDYALGTYFPSVGNTPSIPQSLSLSGSDGKINLTWGDPTDTDGDLRGVEIERRSWQLSGTGAESDWASNAELVVSGSTTVTSDFDLDGWLKIGEVPIGVQAYTDKGNLLPYNPDKVKYQYRIRAIDFGGNASAWRYKGNDINSLIENIPTHAIAATDTTPPDFAGSGVATIDVTGRIGAFSIEINDSSDAVVYEIFRIKAQTEEALNAITDWNTADSVGKVLRGADVTYFTDAFPPTNEIWYAKYRVIAADKWNNWSAPKEGNVAHSYTPDNAGDEIAPKPPTVTNVEYVGSNSSVKVSFTTPTQSVGDTALTDLKGFRLWRTESLSGTIIKTLVSNGTGYTSTTNSAIIHYDYEPVEGTWYYGVSCFDRSENDSDVAWFNTAVVIADNVPPTAPILSHVLGGAIPGTLIFQCSSADADVAYYKIKLLSGGTALFGSSGEDNANGMFVLGDVTDTVAAIKAYSGTIDAFDKAGNKSTLIISNLDAFENEIKAGYKPAVLGTAPNMSGVVVVGTCANKDGVVQVSISSIPSTCALIKVFRAVKLQGGNYGSPLGIMTIPTDGITEYNFEDIVEESVTVQYKVKGISYFGDITDTYKDSADIVVVDYTGVDLETLATTLGVTFLPTVIREIGSLKLRFPDIMNKKGHYYEIWRTPYSDNNGSAWTTTNVYTSTSLQPNPVNPKWELLVRIPSTYKTTTDIVAFDDNAWMRNGVIPSDASKVTPAIDYNRAGRYMIIGCDQFTNRGKPFFINDGGNQSEMGKGWITMPYEAYTQEVPKGAVYFDFNKSAQSTLGHTPLDIPQATLYRNRGIQPTGEFSYLLNELNKDHSVFLRKYDKVESLVGTGAATEVFIYDTRLDDIPNTWRFDSSKSWYNEAPRGFPNTRGTQKEFPEVAIITLFDNDYIVVSDYYTKEQWLTFFRGAADTAYSTNGGAAQSLFMRNGKLIWTQVGNVDWSQMTTVADFIKDLTYSYAPSNKYNQQTIALRDTNGLTSTTDIITGSSNKAYDSKLTYINQVDYLVTAKEDGINVIRLSDDKGLKSLDTSKFIKVAVWNDYIIGLKENDRTVYRSTKKIQSLDWFAATGTANIELEPIVVSDFVPTKKVMRFDGVDDYLESGSISYGITNVWSIEIITTQTSTQIIGSSVDGHIKIGCSSSTIRVGKTSSHTDLGIATTLTPFSAINHYCITSDGTTIKLYRNGIYLQALTYGALTNSSATYYLGITSSLNSIFKGDISLFRIWNKTLTPTRIMELSEGLPLTAAEKWVAGQCIVEYSADNYNATKLYNGTAITNGYLSGTDPNKLYGILPTTQFMEGSNADFGTDTYRFFQKTASKCPTLVDLPIKDSLKSYPQWLKVNKDNKLLIGYSDTVAGVYKGKLGTLTNSQITEQDGIIILEDN